MAPSPSKKQKIPSPEDEETSWLPPWAQSLASQNSPNILLPSLMPLFDSLPAWMSMPFITPKIPVVSRGVMNGIDIHAGNEIHNSKDSRGEPWLWFYEDFLAKYDPEARKQSGV